MMHRVNYNGFEMESESAWEWRAIDKKVSVEADYLNTQINANRVDMGSVHVTPAMAIHQIEGVEWITKMPEEDSGDVLFGAEVKAYDPNQKRGEAGTPQGGRWVKDDGGVVSVSDKDISYWSSYGQNRSFDSEAEAKNWVFRSLNRIDDSASGAIFGKKGEAYNRAFADSLPVYKTDEGFKVGTKLDEPKDSMGWDEIEIEGSTLEDVTTNGLANPFDAPSISPVKNIAINEIQKTESHSDTDAGMEYVSSLASSIKESERFKAILLQGNGDDGYVILDGHHRFEAAKLLEMDDIPSQIISFRDEDDDRITFSHAK